MSNGRGCIERVGETLEASEPTGPVVVSTWRATSVWPPAGASGPAIAVILLVWPGRPPSMRTGRRRRGRAIRVRRSRPLVRRSDPAPRRPHGSVSGHGQDAPRARPRVRERRQARRGAASRSPPRRPTPRTLADAALLADVALAADGPWSSNDELRPTALPLLEEALLGIGDDDLVRRVADHERDRVRPLFRRPRPRGSVGPGCGRARGTVRRSRRARDGATGIASLVHPPTGRARRERLQIASEACEHLARAGGPRATCNCCCNARGSPISSRTRW